MRDAYHDEMDAITDQLVAMTRLVGHAMSVATDALLSSDLAAAESVIDADAAIDALRENVERRTVDLIARQQPVARDLRALTTGLRTAADLERSGDLAAHVAKLARRRFPGCAVPPELQATIRQMGDVAAVVVDKAGDVIVSRDASRAHELEADDDIMDELHKELLLAMLAPDWKYGVDTAIDLALAGRYYERYADHAVSVARQVVYLVTGTTAVRGALQG
ncbi:MAG TPA: phosphate signaling complex protein PhoU [Acidothermaceae bacterium]|nr:phosphate signaling complex protein PhoU [Acidothermaceae bacterium]